jgi:hypothetical protein
VSREPQIGAVPAVTLDRGGRAVVRHTIAWHQYAEDELEVKVTASDPSLTVPATLKLDFDKHQLRFEYEVKAGQKTGEFTVTLTPAAGKAMMVKVVVK